MSNFVPDDAPALVRITVEIPLGRDIVTPDELPTADEVVAWLTEEYLSPCGLIADYDANAKVGMTVLWQYGIATARWSAEGGWKASGGTVGPPS